MPPLARQFKLLRESIGLLAAAGVAPSRLRDFALAEQPFDGKLLELSPLYRRSRELYLGRGGRYRATLVSSPRTLSSPILLEPIIEYSPIERELVWAAMDPIQSRNREHLLGLRTYTASLFHEQSHRILWRELPPPPRSTDGLRRYLNFVESLVVTLDMALGDELGAPLSLPFYLVGVLYDPGTPMRAGMSPRDYRNYLQAVLHATYLNLEFYDPAAIPDAIAALYPMLPDAILARATARSLRLDRGFVMRTNPVWQKRHQKTVARTLARLPGRPWEISADPMDNREQYLFAEKWFDLFSL